jgi:hypothetical protein
MSVNSVSIPPTDHQLTTTEYVEKKVVVDSPQEKKIAIVEVSDEELKKDVEKVNETFKKRTALQQRRKKSVGIDQESEESQKVEDYKKLAIEKTKENKSTNLSYSTKKKNPSTETISKVLPSSTESKIAPATSTASPLLTVFKGEELNKLRFSQKTITHQLSNEGAFLFENPIPSSRERTLFQTLYKDGWLARHKIDVVLMPDGSYTSLDNRRLAVAKAINKLFPNTISVHATPHRYSDKASSDLMHRVSPDSTPPPPSDSRVEKNTYGHAISCRVKERCFGFDEYPIVITGLKGHGKKSIAFDTSALTVKLQKA